MLIAVVMLLCSVTVSAHDFEVDGIFYNIKSTSTFTVQITFEGTKYNTPEYSGEVVIPDKVNYNENSYSVTSIGKDAFRACSGLTSITIPNSVTRIGDYAFEGCSSLTSITIPNSVTSIESNAFRGCSGLTSITIPNSVTSIGNYAFRGCSSLANVTIPNSVTSIGSSAFEGCSSLTNVTIPNSVTNIGSAAFRGCSGITSITIPNSVTSIGSSAFEGCSSLTNVTIPKSVTRIGSSTFEGTPWYNNQPDGIVYVGKVLYKYKGTIPSGTSINIKEGTVEISEKAFDGCSGLTSIIIPNSVTSIRNQAFNYCTSLKKLYIEDGYSTLVLGQGRYIKRSFFYDCPLDTIYLGREIEYTGNVPPFTSSTLTSCFIGDSVTNIGSSTFEGCSSLTNVTIPNSVTSIGSSAFEGCSSLTNVTIPNSVTSIGSSAFEGTPWYNNQPDGVVYLGNILEKYKGEMPNGTSISIKEGTVTIKGSAFEGCTGLTSITIPNSVTGIGSCAFNGCTSLKRIYIEDGSSVLFLGQGNSDLKYPKGLFRSCPLDTIYLGRDIEFVDYDFKGYDFHSPFYNNSTLKSCTIGDSVTKIEAQLFKNCSSLTNVTIPNRVTSIENSAFRGCSGLTSITIPNSVTSIGNFAFEGCSSLTSIYLFSETPVKINSSTFNNYNATLYVPQESIEAYKAADYWKDFTNIVEFDATAIENVSDDAPVFDVTVGGIKFTGAEGKAVAVYSAAGALVEKIASYAGEEITLGKGVYILRVGGKTVKVKL